MKIVLFSQPNVPANPATSPSVAFVTPDQKATYLAAGWVAAAKSGPNIEKPSTASANDLYIDTDGQRLLLHDGVQWRDATTGEYLN
jgi:hypothetical protein